KEHDPANTILPFGFHYFFNNPTKIEGKLKPFGSTGSDLYPFDVQGKTVRLQGADIDFFKYLNSCVCEAINENMKTFPSGTLPDGDYDRSGNTKCAQIPTETIENASDPDCSVGAPVMRFLESRLDREPFSFFSEPNAAEIAVGLCSVTIRPNISESRLIGVSSRMWPTLAGRHTRKQRLVRKDSLSFA
ncbi:MAG TPA: hypothetical protein VIX91_26185, partial [Candidatus Acidoferrum sp.]